MRIPKKREGQVRELRDRLEVTLKINCGKQGGSGCERWEESENDNLESVADKFYDRGWRVKKVVDPPGFKPGTYYLAVCPNCAGSSRQP